MRRLLISLFLLLGIVGTVSAEIHVPTNTFVVTSTANNGASGSTSDGVCTSTASGGVCTLRAAIQEANGTAGTDTISFTINGAGPHVISPLSPLPTITSRVTIDGITQANANCPNVLDPADLRIVLDGTNAGDDANGLLLNDSADNSVIRGLVIINFASAGIELNSTDFVDIECNHIGINADGSTAAPNGTGINIHNAATDNTVGGTTNNSRTQRNVISGNAGIGIYLDNQGNARALISGNYIGTDELGITAVGNGGRGIYTSADLTTIGGDDVYEANVISGNNQAGIYIIGNVRDTTIDGNYIGLNVFGLGDLGNANGIAVVDATSSPLRVDIGLNRPNRIANNDSSGIVIIGENTEEITFRFNEIFDNGALGIDLGDDGVTANDFVDNDPGPNELQNYPTINKADNTTAQGSAINKVTVEGTLYSNVSSSFTLDFYYSNACDPSGFGEGEVYVGSTTVNTNGAQGSAFFSIDFDNISGTNVVPPTDSYLTATATDADGNTSEFSQCKVVTNESTLTVNTNDDENDGTCNASHCSLREAINAANSINDPESGTILFDVSDGYIKIGSALPSITQQVRILGTSQTGAACPVDEETSAVIYVHLDYVGGGTVDGLHLAAGSDNSQISGLAITNFTADGIQIDSDDNFIYCNHIGIAPDGQTPGGNAESGIEVTGEENTIGGALATLRNVISANGTNGVHLSGGRFNDVVGNIIGLEASGKNPVGNKRDGVRVESSLYNSVGGSTVSERNIISGNSLNGAYVNSTNQAVSFKGNYIGLTLDGKNAAGNDTNGVHISGGFLNSVGGANVGDGNIISSNGGAGVRLDGGANVVTVQGNIIGRSIASESALPNSDHGIILNGNGTSNNLIADNIVANNARDGVRVFSDSGNKISQNSIFDNGQLGIDIGSDGVQVNDSGDGDSGANTLINFPELLISADNLTVVGTLDSTANSNYTIEFFHNTSCDLSDNGEGERYIGSHDVTLPADGTFQFTAVFYYPDVPVGDFVTATTTDADGNTSEFSNCLQVTDAFIVNATNDLARDLGDGQCNASTGSALGGASCTLRGALEEANTANLPSRTIYFAIEGDAPHTISPDTALPSVASSVILDGVTYQADASCPSQLNVILDGQDLTGSTIDGLNFNGSSAGSTVRGLIIGNFPRAAIHIRRAYITIACNGLGVNVFASGASSNMPNQYGVMVEGNRTTIGGNAVADRNTIGNNTLDGIAILYPSNDSIEDTTITNNYIGVSKNGMGYESNDRHGVSDFRSVRTTFLNNTISGNIEDGVNLNESIATTFLQNNIGVGADKVTGIRNFGNGIALGGTSDTQILGYTSTGAENVIAFNGEDGIYASEAFDLVVTGNLIGMGVNGQDRGNGGHGIYLDRMNGAQIGGLFDNNWGELNLIFFNGGDGIAVVNGTGHALAQNLIYANDEIGIDLNADGATPNDGATDPDSGANRLQNYPLISSSNTAGVTSGTMFGVNGDYDLYFYNNDACDSSGYGEGQRLITGQRVTISSGNQVAFNVNLGSQTLNSQVTAVAVNVTTGDTSEFSPCANVDQGPPTAVAVSQQQIVNSVQGRGIVLIMVVLSLCSVVAIARREARYQQD